MKFTSDNITSLQPNEIFVFGSNLAGRHGAGAAKTAFRLFGAIYGQGVGLQGDSYGIPTKNWQVTTLPLPAIARYINDFIVFASNNPDKTFLVSQIGCGLAGYSKEEIAPLFRNAPSNCVLPEAFHDVNNAL